MKKGCLRLGRSYRRDDEPPFRPHAWRHWPPTQPRAACSTPKRRGAGPEECLRQRPSLSISPGRINPFHHPGKLDFECEITPSRQPRFFRRAWFQSRLLFYIFLNIFQAYNFLFPYHSSSKTRISNLNRLAPTLIYPLQFTCWDVELLPTSQPEHVPITCFTLPLILRVISGPSQIIISNLAPFYIVFGVFPSMIILGHTPAPYRRGRGTPVGDPHRGVFSPFLRGISIRMRVFF